MKGASNAINADPKKLHCAPLGQVMAGVNLYIGESTMAPRAFYSFHYKSDNWRASQIRNMGGGY